MNQPLQSYRKQLVKLNSRWMTKWRTKEKERTKDEEGLDGWGIGIGSVFYRYFDEINDRRKESQLHP